MTLTVDVHELPARFAELVAFAAAGNEVLVADGAQPRVRLVALTANKPRVLGLHPGAFEPHDDFDAPLPEEFWAGSFREARHD